MMQSKEDFQVNKKECSIAQMFDYCYKKKKIQCQIDIWIVEMLYLGDRVKIASLSDSVMFSLVFRWQMAAWASLIMNN